MVRSGRKKTAVLSESFRLDGGGEMRVPLGVIGELDKGSVDVELHIRKDSAEMNSANKGRRRVADMYNRQEYRLTM